MPARNQVRGFTLIELLVVITIIVVLLALLVPAMDKAIYQAELAMCASNQHSVTLGVITYAHSNRRLYPYRPTVKEAWPQAEPHFLRALNMAQTRAAIDDRTYLVGYVDLKLLMDPLVEAVDLSFEASDPDTVIYGQQNLWWGWQYENGAEMKRIGDRFSWTTVSATGSVTQRFNYLMTDRDMFSGDRVYGSHPDRDGVMRNYRFQNEDFGEAHGAVGEAINGTASEWIATVTRARGLIEMNSAADDGSVSRLTDVKRLDDDRLEQVPLASNGNGFNLDFTHLRRP